MCVWLTEWPRMDAVINQSYDWQVEWEVQALTSPLLFLGQVKRNSQILVGAARLGEDSQ